MTSRERVRAALSHEEADRVPFDIGSWIPTSIHVQAYRRLLQVLEIEDDSVIGNEIGQLARISEPVLERLGADLRGLRIQAPRNSCSRLPDGSLQDTWGVVWRKPEGATSYSIVSCPLAEWPRRRLECFAWPDGRDAAQVEGLAEEARRLHQETGYALLGEVCGHIFERAQMLRGFDTFLLDLADTPAFAEELLDRITEVEGAMIATFLDAVGPYLDVVAFKDDIGMQSGPVISPPMFRRFIKPRLARLVEVICFHTCGSVEYAIRDLVDIGVEVLNPVQVAAAGMDPARLKATYGHNLSFWGGVDTQQVLPFGTPERVEAEVRRRMAELGPGGGYVLASVHNIEADVPGENILAMADAVRRWGSYPL
jgi:uroporphyrinogen decarboxylase